MRAASPGASMSGSVGRFSGRIARVCPKNQYPASESGSSSAPKRSKLRRARSADCAIGTGGVERRVVTARPCSASLP